MTNHINDFANSDVILIMGGNPAENHPCAFKWITKAMEKGAKLVVVDPRGRVGAAFTTPHMAHAFRSSDVPEPVVRL